MFDKYEEYLKSLSEVDHFIRNRKYINVIEKIEKEGFSLPTKKQIHKIDSNKKRIVYTFPEEENYVLKLLTYLVIRQYDAVFSKNLYSFRTNYGVRQAFNYIRAVSHIENYYTYKVDISDYFNSINVELLLPKLRTIFADDVTLYEWIEALLTNPYVLENGLLKKEMKGVMAGCPIAVFLANVYLSELDKVFADERKIYFRYSDDIIIFSKTKEELEDQKNKLLSIVDAYNLKINPSKQISTVPGESWTFLGLKYDGNQIDVSDIALKKIKAKMRRKTRALIRWKNLKNKESIFAVKAFINAFNKKFFNNTDEHDMTWARWYFPVITTDKGLKIIDHYMQECVRYIATEKHTKSSYNFRYNQMKDLGYESLVNNWYQYKNTYCNPIKLL